MTHPVAMPVIVVLMQYYPGGGTAVPVPRQGNTSVISTYLTMEDCNRDRYSRGRSEDFFCVEFKSDKIIDYTFPQDKQHQGLNGVIVGPIALKDADKPYIEPLVEVAKPEPPKETAAPKKVAQRLRQERRQAVFEGDPLNAVASLFRDW
jgi:hypothetical protein